MSGLALAVHDLDLFELEGNAVIDLGGDDWIQIYCDAIDPDRTAACAVGSGDPKLAGTPASNALVSVFAFDPFDPAQDDIFTKGGSKDSRDISRWNWKMGTAGDKGDLEHAYAALYRDLPSLDFILYFGTDRFSNNGDAALGFWFTQDEVDLNPPPRPGGVGTFDGSHRDGDVLVQVDWLQGANAVPRIEGFLWDSSCIGNGDAAWIPAAAKRGIRCPLSPRLKGARMPSAASSPNIRCNKAVTAA